MLGLITYATAHGSCSGGPSTKPNTSLYVFAKNNKRYRSSRLNGEGDVLDPDDDEHTVVQEDEAEAGEEEDDEVDEHERAAMRLRIESVTIAV